MLKNMSHATFIVLWLGGVNMAELNGTSSGQWSEVDANNTSAVPDGWPSGVFPNQVEPIGRSTMGALKRAWDRVNGTVTTTGSSGHYIYTPSNTSFPTALVNGEEFSWKAHQDSVGADDFNLNSLGAKPLFKISSAGPVAIAAGDIKANARLKSQYDSALASGSGAWMILAGLVVASGGGGSTPPGGSNGQIQYNNAGGFGGMSAVNGDGTLNTATGALVVTKTNGASFAPSATTDTTNAGNLSSGTVNPARLPLGSSSAFGAVKVDNTTITATGGVISANSAGLMTPLGVGSIILAQNVDGTAPFSVGTTKVAANLAVGVMNQSGGFVGSGDSITGTWKALQSSAGTLTTGNCIPMLWQRIA